MFVLIQVWKNRQERKARETQKIKHQSLMIYVA